MSPAAVGLAALLWSALVTPSCGKTGSAPCPRALDCARLGRHFCRPGTWRCGACVQPLVQDSRGRCVGRRRTHQRGQHTGQSATGTVSFPELEERVEEQVDVLASIVSEQRSKAIVGEQRSKAIVGEQRSKAIVGEQRSKAIVGEQRSKAIVGEQRSKVTLTAPPPLKGPAPSAAPTETPANRSSALLSAAPELRPPSDADVFIVMSSVFIVTGSIALMIAGACWVRLQRGVRRSQKALCPYGLMRPNTFNSLPGDRRLVQNAQMFHYQHQRQQMLCIHRHSESPKEPDSGASDDDGDDDGDFTVYECPGLAPTGEMEVMNPLFDDSTLHLHRFHK